MISCSPEGGRFMRLFVLFSVQHGANMNTFEEGNEEMLKMWDLWPSGMSLGIWLIKLYLVTIIFNEFNVRCVL